MEREALAQYLNERLECQRFKDYCPNGLQVEGRAGVHTIVTGVSASQALLDEAVRRNADAIIVHHGYFWRGEDSRVVGLKRRRLATLIAHDINLFAFHLPLDAHPELGNNAQLAARCGWIPEGRFGEQDLGWHGRLPAPRGAEDLAAHLGRCLGRPPLLLPGDGRSLRRLAWCSGGAQSWFEAAIELGVDAFVTGEVSEQHTHLARESGVAFLAAGHHATESGGVAALGQHLADHLGLAVSHVDIPNPV